MLAETMSDMSLRTETSSLSMEFFDNYLSHTQTAKFCNRELT